MPTLKHPTFSNVTVDVSDADVSKWRDAGWKGQQAKSVDEKQDEKPKTEK